MATTKIPGIPHSWAVDDWPPTVFPGRASRARYITRVHRDSLLAAGALTRIGRELVVLGAAYSAWLSKHSSRVENFEIAANRARRATEADAA